MQIRWKYGLWVNGMLLAIWALYIYTAQIWDKQDMLRIEARCLQRLAKTLQKIGFEQNNPLPTLADLLRVMAQANEGTEIMVLDADSVIFASGNFRRHHIILLSQRQ